MKDSILEKALLQANMLEEAIKTNAKGILADTMKQEINSLVKESLENEMSANAETDIEEQDFGFANSDDEDENDVDSSEEDNDESDNEDSEEEMSSDDDEDSDDDDASDDFTDFSTDDTDTDMEDDSDEDSDFESDDDEPIDMTSASDDDILKIFKKMGDEDGIIVKKEDNGDVELNVNGEEFLVKLNEDEELDSEEELDEEEIDVDEQEEEEPLYEIVFDDEDGMDDTGMMGHDGSDLEGIDEVPSHGFDLDGGFDDEFSDDDEFGGDIDDINLDGDTSNEDEFLLDDDLNMDAPEAEFQEAARTIGMGNRKGALHKGTRTFNRNNVREHQELKRQVKVLKEKNEEYKKALNLFRDKLNEVAVFNANLAYATRLFTEHSTTKQEKMEILKRFDNTATLKESQNLYKTIKGELNTKSTISESVVEKIVKTPSKGSSSKEILAESKAYTSPQFARMKDLFNKIK